MTSPRLTPAAARALDLAANLANAEGAKQILPHHLLWALVLQESRAAEILASSGLSRERLENLMPLGVIHFDEAILSGPPAENSPPDAPLSADCRQVVERAAQHVRGIDRTGEVGSEHLLWGLSAVDSSVRTLLEQHGLHGEAVAARASESSGLSADPLEVDVQLERGPSSRSEETDVLRIVDAAANRAREGLRVLEDYVRFALDDPRTTEQLKCCRHDLSETLQQLDPRGLLRCRDTAHDVGTVIHTPQEAARGSVQDVLLANFKRTQEALRTLEEFGKLLHSGAGELLGRVRYQLYELERDVLLRHDARSRLEGCDVYLLLTGASCRRGVEETLKSSLAGGVRIVQVREKQMADRELLAHLHIIRRHTRSADAVLIVNDRPDLAVLCDADGVHVGQEELTVRDARRIVGPGRLIGVSTHSLEQARQAVADGADYLGVGPTFPSRTKQFSEFTGLELLRRVAAEISIPWFAIGGIDANNVEQVAAAGAQRIAVSSAVCAAESPEEMVRTLRRKLSRQSR